MNIEHRHADGRSAGFGPIVAASGVCWVLAVALGAKWFSDARAAALFAQTPTEPNLVYGALFFVSVVAALVLQAVASRWRAPRG